MAPRSACAPATRRAPPPSSPRATTCWRRCATPATRWPPSPRRSPRCTRPPARSTSASRSTPVRGSTWAPSASPGCKRVHEAYVRDRLTLHPGERFDPTTIEAARQDLAGLGVFSEVRVEPAKTLDAEGRLPLHFVVTERQAAAGRFRRVLFHRPGARPVGRLAPSQPVRQWRAAQPDRQRLGRRQCADPPRLQARRAVHQAGLPGARPVAAARGRRAAPGPAGYTTRTP